MHKRIVCHFVVVMLAVVCNCSIGLAQNVPINLDTTTTHKEPSALAFDPKDVLLEHVLDNHEYHFATLHEHEANETIIAIPLPIIVYQIGRGWACFMSSKFEHGHSSYNGYNMAAGGDIVALNKDGNVDTHATLYDLSLTRNITQMLLSAILFVWLMLNVAKRYKRNSVAAPKGVQNLMEIIIVFLRDEVGKPYLGDKANKYMPYILSVFFFILVNNITGLIPGAANVTGNIAFTSILGLIAFVAILISTNKHFWAHIFNPPNVPFAVKFILVPVEILGLFTKPFALIVRLFANMIAGHMVITCLIMMIFIFAGLSKVAGISFVPVSLAFTIFIYLIEILVAFIQAFVFANLTAVFVGQAFEGTEKDH